MAESAGRYYVLDVVRRQVPASIFASDLARLQESYGHPPTVMYASGRDWEQIEVMRKLGAPIVGKPASTDKYVRAQGLSAKWNDLVTPAGVIEREGLVYLQSGAHWLGQYTSVLMDFTGHGDDHDDDVDATVAAFDALPSSALSAGPSVVVPQADVEARPRRDPALTVRGRGKLGTW
jgi:predicted phage terminase large subunit-like protein